MISPHVFDLAPASMKRITAGLEPSLPWLRASEMLLSATRGWGPIFEANRDGSASNVFLQLLQQKATTLPLKVVVMPGLAASPVFTGHMSLTGLLWNDQARPAPRRTATTALKAFIPRSLSRCQY